MLSVVNAGLCKCVITYCFSYLFGISHGKHQNLTVFRRLGLLATYLYKSGIWSYPRKTEDYISQPSPAGVATHSKTPRELARLRVRLWRRLPLFHVFFCQLLRRSGLDQFIQSFLKFGDHIIRCILAKGKTEV